MDLENLKSGHRERLKDRFLKSSEHELPDYEIIELILFFANPRTDMKPLAKNLLAKYNDIGSILAADYDNLKEFPGINNSAMTLFKLIKETSVRIAKESIINKSVISSWENVIEYLRTSMGYSPIEIFRVIYLNKNNIIISDETLQEGTVDQVNIYPREILKRSIILDATAIILVHNHPSGKAKPSISDIELTNNISTILAPLNIVIHDHVIITNNKYYSFKSEGII